MNEAENKNERTVLAGASREKQKYFFKKLIKNIAIILLAMIVLYKCELSEYVSQCAFTMFFICIFAILNRIRR